MLIHYRKKVKNLGVNQKNDKILNLNSFINLIE